MYLVFFNSEILLIISIDQCKNMSNMAYPDYLINILSIYNITYIYHICIISAHDVVLSWISLFIQR